MPGRIHNPVSLVLGHALTLPGGGVLRPGTYRGWQRTSGRVDQYITYEVTLCRPILEAAGLPVTFAGRTWDVTEAVESGIVTVGPASG